jgi:hypothetical protein
VFELHDVLNEFLQQRGHYPLSSIAGTIFPASHYLHGGAKAVFNEFPSLYPKMKEGWGTYAYRMLDRSAIDDEGNSSMLEIPVEKLKKQKQKGE